MYPVHPEMIHRNNPKHEIFRFDIQSEMATEIEFKTLVLTTLIIKKTNSKKSQFICFGLKENGKSLV